MRVPTTWINNDVKAPAPWTAPAKTPAPWANNVTKNPVQYTTTGKQKNAWGPNYMPPQTYFYNDPDMTYNSPNVDYNYLVNNNRLNSRLVTKWKAS